MDLMVMLVWFVMMMAMLLWLALLRVLELMLQSHVLHEKMSIGLSCVYPNLWKGLMYMVMMYTCSYSKHNFIRKVVVVFSHKGFPQCCTDNNIPLNLTI